MIEQLQFFCFAGDIQWMHNVVDQKSYARHFILEGVHEQKTEE